MTLFLPLVSFSIFWIIFNAGVPQGLPVLVHDADQSQTSRRLTRMLDTTRILTVAGQVTDLNQGMIMIRQGRAHALIHMPPHMERDILKGEAPAIVDYYNNAYLLIGSLIHKTVSQVVTTASKGINLLTREKKTELPDAAMMHIEPVAVRKHVLFNPYLNYFYYLTGTLQPAMLQIFIIFMTIFSFGIELKQGTGPGLYESGLGNTAAVIIGKLLPYSIIYILVGLFMNISLFQVPGFPFNGDLRVVVIGTVLFVFACQAMGLLMLCLTANMRMSLSLAAFYSATAFAFVGVTFPDTGMVMPAKLWARLLPLTYYISIFIEQAVKGAPFHVSLTNLYALSFFILAGILFSWHRMNKIMKDPTYWGRS